MSPHYIDGSLNRKEQPVTPEKEETPTGKESVEGSYMDEAVEAAAEAMYAEAPIAFRFLSSYDRDYALAKARGMVEAAEPFIRADERSKLEARLLSDEVLGAVEEAFDAAYEVNSGIADTDELWRAAIRAALASQEKDEEKGP
jgi:hypothetical protein